MFSGSFATTGSWERAKQRSPPSRRRPPKRVRDQEKTCPVLHPLQKMVISQNLLRKTPRRSLLRRRITKCPRAIARYFSLPLVDRPHAVSLLVEHLVWTPALR